MPTQREIDEQNDAFNQLHAAAEAYRSGEMVTALARLDAIPAQSARAHAIAQRVRTMTESGKTGRPLVDLPSTVEILPWNVPLARALGALEMEVVLRGYHDRASRSQVETMTTALAAESLLGAVEEAGEPYAGSRWETAIALTAFGEGQIGWASRLLDTPCREPDADPDVLLACGALHGVMASQPADVLTADVQETRSRPPGFTGPSSGPKMLPPPDMSSASLPAGAEAIRRSFADRALREFDGVLRQESANAEARLRSAGIHLVLHQDAAAARLLDPLVAAAVDARTTYLASLFLGGVRARAGQADAAVALFERAIAAMPSGQSAFIALAEIERARGDAAATAAAIERMLRAPSAPRDPWAEFAYGPYWRVQPMLRDLREQARR